MQWRSPTWLTILRLDPDEMPPSHRFEVGPITLAANNTTNRQKPYLITYSLIGSNSTPSTSTTVPTLILESADAGPRVLVVSVSSSLGSKRVILADGGVQRIRGRPTAGRGIRLSLGFDDCVTRSLLSQRRCYR